LPSTVDTTNNTVTGRTNHLSIFQIMAAIPPSDTANVRAYPNPYRPSLGHTSISLVGLPADATISIYTLTGELVKELTADSNGISNWDARTSHGDNAASGLYYVYVEQNGSKKALKLVIQR